MANLYLAYQPIVIFASPKDMINVFNDSSQGTVVRCYRFMIANSAVFRNSGALTTLQIRRIYGVNGDNTTAASNGGARASSIPLSMDSGAPPCDSDVTQGTGQSTPSSGQDVFRQVVVSVATTLTQAVPTWDAWETQLPYTVIGDYGFTDTNTEPITCRAGQGGEIYNSGALASGNLDFGIEFTA